MNIRRITSLTAALSFLIMVLTSIILYIVPQGRVAYWADWKLWGLSKTDWGNIHINLGFVFLIALSVHVYYNWKPLIKYLRNKAKAIKVFTPEFNVALAISAFCAIGSYLLIPPFGWVMSLNDHFKDAGAAKYGEPPYGHAELSSLKTFAKKLNLDLARSLELLNQAGYPVEDSMLTLKTIGHRYRMPPQQVYETIKPALILPNKNFGDQSLLPESPPPGTGNLTLADFCTQYDLNNKLLLRKLASDGIVASADMTLKQIANQNQKSPIDIYEMIKNNAGN